MSVLIVFALLFLAAPLPAQEQQFADLGTCALESGETLEDCRVGYRTLGMLNEARDNAILIPTWYRGTGEPWVERQAVLLGEDHGYFVIIIDALGIGVSVSPSNSEAQPLDAFPQITTRDMVHSQYRVATEVLELDGVYAVMGISMGGMQAFEWAVRYPEFMQRVIPIAGSPRLAGHDVALWEAYKRLLRWGADCQCDAAGEAMMAIGILNATTSDQAGADLSGSDVLAQIAEGGERRITLGSALDGIRQADAMIATDVTHGFDGDWAAAAEAVQARVLIIAGASDHVVTPRTGEIFAEFLGEKATSIVFQNDCGHNIPGCEMFRARSLIREFLRR
ncbi:MAG: alpha/beta hydrolase [Wenzhouxiangella sp.]|jgi:homoserine O-acetyltransferase|nr:alpha/beta hydrolase [Wenzhouxiangella sp.]